MWHCALSLAAGLAALAGGVAPALAQSEPAEPAAAPVGDATGMADRPAARGERPRAAGRIVRRFDFEEQLTNPGEVPQFWFRNQDRAGAEGRLREGFPSWNRASLSYASEGGLVWNGDGAVRLPTSGGSTSLLLEPGVLAVFPDTDYRVWTSVRTRGLTHARAGMVTRLLDARLQVIEGSQRVSELVQSEEGWRQLIIDLPPTPEGAAWLQLELVLLQQPQARNLVPPAPDVRDQFFINQDDLAGEAIFDDVTVMQMPRVELSSSALGNLLPASEPVELTMQVRDLASEALRIEADVLDAGGVVVDSTRVELAGATTVTRWQPRLATRGWYRARMRLKNPQGMLISARTLDFGWLDLAKATGERSVRGADATRFGVVLTQPLDAELDQLPELARNARAGSLTMPLWTIDQRSDAVLDRTQRLVGVVRELVSNFTEVSLSLAPMPRALATDANVDVRDGWSLVMGDGDRWLPYAQDAFEKLGPMVRSWHMGVPGVTGPYWARSRGGAWPKAAVEAFEARVPGSALALPADVRQAWAPGPLLASTVPVQLVAQVPAGLSAAGLRASAEGWSATLALAPRRVGAMFAMQAGPGDTPPKARIDRLVRQTVEAWRLLGASPRAQETAPLSLGLVDPWKWAAAQAQPTPELAAWTALASRLSARRIVGAFPHEGTQRDGGIEADGLVCWILGAQEGGGPGALVAWNERAAPGSGAMLEVPFVGRDGPRATDVFGNPVAVLVDESTDAGAMRVARVRVGTAPVFIEGVDVDLARFVAGVGVTPALLDASRATDEHTIELSNPFPFGISGKVSILEPGGFSVGQPDRTWRITPRTSAFTIAPGERLSLPFSVSFGRNEEAGPKPFVLSIELNAERSSGRVLVRREAELGVRDMRLDLSATAIGGGAMAVEAILANTGERTLNVELTALTPGAPRSRATISNLEPGQQGMRRFVLAPEGVAGTSRRVVVVVTDPETELRLVRSVTIDDVPAALPVGSGPGGAPVAIEATPR